MPSMPRSPSLVAEQHLLATSQELPMADRRFPTAGQSDRCLDGGSGLVADKNKQRRDSDGRNGGPMDRRSGEEPVSTLGEEALQNLFSVVSASGGGGGNFLVAQQLAALVLPTQLTGLGVREDNDSSDVSHDGNGGGEVTITIDPPPTEPKSVSAAMSPKPLPRSLLAVSLLTLSMAMTTVFYKAPSGVLFGRNKLAYYLAIACIFVAGVAEAGTAFWISRSLDAYKRHFLFGRVVLCASLGPLVTVMGIGGFAFFQG